MRDRFTGTAVLTAAQAAGLGALGYVARASGLDVDARYDHPVPGIVFPPAVATAADGDVLSRFMMRAHESARSVPSATEFIHRLDGQLGAAGTTAFPSSPGGQRSGTGIAEGWRATITHRVELAAEGTLARVKIVDPSFFNWLALPVALTDTIVPDFPLVNKSFNLSYAGNDL